MNKVAPPKKKNWCKRDHATPCVRAWPVASLGHAECQWSHILNCRRLLEACAGVTYLLSLHFFGWAWCLACSKCSIDVCWMDPTFLTRLASGAPGQKGATEENSHSSRDGPSWVLRLVQISVFLWFWVLAGSAWVLRVWALEPDSFQTTFTRTLPWILYASVSTSAKWR